MGVRSVEADQGITPKIAHALTGIVHRRRLERAGFEKVPVSELTQLGLNSRSYSPGPYSDREDLLYAFDRIIVGEPEAGA